MLGGSEFVPMSQNNIFNSNSSKSTSEVIWRNDNMFSSDKSDGLRIHIHIFDFGIRCQFLQLTTTL